MKTRTLISLFTLALAAGSSACTAESQPQQSATEQTATTSEAQLMSAMGDIIAWPVGPIAWDGLNATWPISVWSPNLIGGLAFDIAGMTNLSVTCAGCGLTAVPITGAYLNAFIPPAGALGIAGTPFLGAAGLYAPAYGYGGLYAPYTGLAGYGFGAFGAGAAYQGTFLNGALNAGWGLLDPTLTSSALLFTNLAVLSTSLPYTFNVTFAAQTAAQATALTAQSAALNTAALSIFATPIAASALAAQTATIPFMSMAFPILSPLLL